MKRSSVIRHLVELADGATRIAALPADEFGTGASIVEPGPGELEEWLREQLVVSEAHLREVLDRYGEGSWRRRHSGGGVHPDDHLWRAAWAVQSRRDALDELGDS